MEYRHAARLRRDRGISVVLNLRRGHGCQKDRKSNRQESWYQGLLGHGRRDATVISREHLQMQSIQTCLPFAWVIVLHRFFGGASCPGTRWRHYGSAAVRCLTGIKQADAAVPEAKRPEPESFGFFCFVIRLESRQARRKMIFNCVPLPISLNMRCQPFGGCRTDTHDGGR
jgi:hypothetical protein